MIFNVVINEVKEMLRKNKISNMIEKKNKKIIVHVSVNDELDAQQVIKYYPWYIVGKIIITPY